MKHRLLGHCMQKALVIAIASIVVPVLHAQDNQKTLFLISNTHLDTQWNWDVKTTINEYIKNTLNQNMTLMDKYPNFMLNYEGAIKYMWMKEYYPAEYNRMKDYIASGRWHVSGMSVDANDVMVSSAESILHSMLYANKFYQKEFGVRGGYDIMLPDCFGFSYALPSLAKHAGIRGFHTAKLGWGAAAYDKLPPFGVWQGVDGSQIYAIYKPGAYDNHEDYNKDLTNDAGIINAINNNLSKYGVPAEFRYVGPRGDRGGALRDDATTNGENTPYWLNYNAGKKDGAVRVRLASTDEVFDYLDAHNNDKLQVWNGELPMRSHGVGAYTSRGELKLWNRKNELLADAAEKAASLAYWLRAMNYPSDELASAWIKTIWQQHHDGITGTSIPKAYEYSQNEYFTANKAFVKQLQNAVGAMVRYLDTNVEGIPVIVYNPLSHNRTDIAEARIAVALSQIVGTDGEYRLRVLDKDGNEVLAQVNGYSDGMADIIFAASVPSLGYAVYDVRPGEASSLTSTLSINEAERSMTNDRYSVKLNRYGDISELKDNKNSRSLMSSSQLQMIYDHQDTWPAWEISYTDVCRTASSTVKENCSVELEENGPLRKSWLVRRSGEGSSFVQHVRMSAISNRVDFVTEVDWQSRERMLKVAFPFRFSNEKATYDISLGTIERGVRTADHYEMQGHQWADQSSTDGKYGVSILNDSKYGWDKPNASYLRLTLLHTPSCGQYQHQAEQDLGANNFTYSVFPHDGRWSEETQIEAARLNQPLMTFTADKHEGCLGKELRFVDINTEKVAVKALKKAEDNDQLIVRLYEWTGNDQKDVTLTFPTEVLSATLVNALEETEDMQDIRIEGKSVTFDINKYQPKSLAVRLASPSGMSIKEVGEEVVASQVDIPLAYNLDMFSFDSSRGNASTLYTYAYPAEQIPDVLTVDGIAFSMGPKTDGKSNAYRCTGKAITVPEVTKHDENTMVYLLMASGNVNGSEATVTIGGETYNVHVPYLSGYAGQTATSYNTGACFRMEEIALNASHAHKVTDKSNVEMRQMYIYKFALPAEGLWKEGVTSPTISITSSEKAVLLFAATVASNPLDKTSACQQLVTTIDYRELGGNSACGDRLVTSKVTYSHQNGADEAAAKANDNDATTKWCVVGSQSATPWIEYNFNKEVEVCSYVLLNAGIESNDFITRSWKVQAYIDNAWTDIDNVSDNIYNKVERTVAPVKTNRIRLQILQGEQNGKTTRVYEFDVHGSMVDGTDGVQFIELDRSNDVGNYTTDGIKLPEGRRNVNPNKVVVKQGKKYLAE